MTKKRVRYSARFNWYLPDMIQPNYNSSDDPRQKSIGSRSW